jgi:uncharacterized DUF497 family protein
LRNRNGLRFEVRGWGFEVQGLGYGVQGSSDEGALLKIRSVIWHDYIKEKLLLKHDVEFWEVEEVLENKPKFLFREKGRIQGEDVYNALGVTDAGRYLSVYFVYKKTQDAFIISARNMTDKERRRYGKK